MSRESGILLHVSSLPSKYGIGTFGKEAYRFVDFLDKTNQSYWQILPLGPTSYGDSPYQTFSAYATNPYFIDLDILVSEGLLLNEEIISSETGTKVDYEKIYNDRYIVLRKAFNRFDKNNDSYQTFLREQKEWLDDYALFMALKKNFDGVSWQFWPQEIRVRDEETIKKLKNELKDEICFQLFLQYKAHEQFFQLKNYANAKGVKIIGDIPIYVAYDSSDVWTNPKLFQLDESRNMTNVAGVPPDGFTADGQLWGNPLYAWDEHERNGFDWWIKRIQNQTKLYDMVRIDHFIGFENYYSVPAKDKTAVNGVWKKGPGIRLFNKVKETLGDLNIIAEDLGVITDDVRKLLKSTNYPGMKLLQFAFDSREVSDYIPYLYNENTIAYTGTHDNETTKEWFSKLNEKDLEYCRSYINCQIKGTEVDSLIKTTLATKSKIVIIPMQDYLNLGKEARMNIPSTLGNNWVWRMSGEYLTDDLIVKIKEWVKIYGRNK
ncbi:MAG: 4-alpha-glucanotransferase [Acholeplasma sp.]|nr:4-alpha-glucanotransferase [Acholeplasma sp.]